MPGWIMNEQMMCVTVEKKENCSATMLWIHQITIGVNLVYFCLFVATCFSFFSFFFIVALPENIAKVQKKRFFSKKYKTTFIFPTNALYVERERKYQVVCKHSSVPF